MGPARTGSLLNVAAFAILGGGSSAAFAADAAFLSTNEQAGPAKFELIDSSRLGCGEGFAKWTSATAGIECAFDTATRGVRIAAMQEFDKGAIETYATVAHTTAGAFTPDELLVSPQHRSTEATDFFLVGLKGTAFEERLKFTTEFASAKRIVADLLRRDWTLVDESGESGTSSLVRVEARLASSPRLSWSLTAELRSVSENYVVGRSDDLSRYAAMPGTRWSLSSRGRLGQLGFTAGLDRLRSPYGEAASHKAGVDLHGVSLRLVARDAKLRPVEGSSLLDSRTRTTSAYIDLDPYMIAMSLTPDIGDPPSVVPTMLSLSFRSGETESRYVASTERSERSSLGIDGTWETPIGETVLSYWRDARTARTASAVAWSSEMMQVSHFVRRGNWRFGLDASFTSGSGDGSSSYDERSWSFGQSVAYSAPDGPEFRLALGQDRGAVRMRDDSFGSTDDHSRITASLDLSPYLQKRFERPDLRLTFDYRKAMERSDSVTNYFDGFVERWVDDHRREGFLMSFGMKL